MASSPIDLTAIRPTVADLVYARRPERSMCLDLYLPARRPAPVVVWLHGGGWYQGAKGSPYVSFLVHDGYAVVDAEYRLTSEAPAPANLHDVLAAMRWLKQHAAEYGLDTGRMALAGGSAGAHLALLAAAAPEHPAWIDPAANGTSMPRVQAVCALSGPTDIACVEKVAGHPRAEEFRQMLCALLGGPYEEHLELARVLSPITWVCPDLPPTFIFHGDADETIDLDQAHRYVAAMRAAGADVTYHEEAGGGHIRDSWDWAAVSEAIRRFFREKLPPGR